MRPVSARNFGVKLLAAFALMGVASFATAQTAENLNLARDVSLDQKLNEQLPLDIPFTDEMGKPVKLSDYFGKRPIILMLPFYQCRGSCALELEGLLGTLNKLNYSAGKEFDVIIASIHPKETPKQAMAKKKVMMDFYRKASGGGAEGWHYLTGNWDSITRLTKSVGFRFVYDAKKDQIAHPAGFMVLTPKGKLSRYFFGVNYNPQAVTLSLVEAGENKIGSVAEKITLYCSAFDMAKGKYSLSVMRLTQVAGVITAILLASMVGYMSFKYRRTPLYKDSLAHSGNTPKSV